MSELDELLTKLIFYNILDYLINDSQNLILLIKANFGFLKLKLLS